MQEQGYRERDRQKTSNQRSEGISNDSVQPSVSSSLYIEEPKSAGLPVDISHLSSGALRSLDLFFMLEDQQDEQLPSERKEIRVEDVNAEAQRLMEGGLTRLFDSLIDGAVELINESVQVLVPTLLGAALFPILGPVAAGIGAIAVASAMTSIPEVTLDKLVQPLREEQADESKPYNENLKQSLAEAVLSRALPEILSKDRQANEDLKMFFIDLVPTIQKAAKSTNITISGPVQGLIAGDNNTITQTFSDFLPDKG